MYFGALRAFWQSCTFLMRSSASAAFVYQNVVPLNPNASCRHIEIFNHGTDDQKAPIWNWTRKNVNLLGPNFNYISHPFNKGTDKRY